MEDNGHSGPQTCLLIVDDEAQLRRMYARLLTRKFDEVVAVATPEEAEQTLKTHIVTHLVVDRDLGPAYPCGEYLIGVWRKKHASIRRALLISGSRTSNDKLPADIDMCLSKTEDPICLFEALGVDA